MKCIVLFLVCVMALKTFPAAGRPELRFLERLSLAFDEFSVNDDSSLHATLGGFAKCSFYVKTGSITARVSNDENRSFVLKPGERLSFGRSAILSLGICLLSNDDSEVEKVVFPEELKAESSFIWIRMGDLEAFVGCSSHRAYIPAENVSMDVPLPFKAVWPNQRDYDLWASGLGCRYRLKKVGIVSEGEKQLAGDLFRHFSATNLADLVGGSCVAGTTNVQVAASDVPGNVVPGLVGSLFGQIDGTNAQLRVSGFSFVTQDGECRRARRYRLDFRGCLTWGWRVDRANENGTPGRTVLDMPFEYDAEGVLRRAWTQGSNPLMIDKGDKLYFVGDRDLLIQFREEAFRALDGLPWQK